VIEALGDARIPVVVGGIIPEGDVAALQAAAARLGLSVRTE
jgi:methylmalonyl-CoA mutase cobalamin-binding subunit